LEDSEFLEPLKKCKIRLLTKKRKVSWNRDAAPATKMLARGKVLIQYSKKEKEKRQRNERTGGIDCWVFCSASEGTAARCKGN